MENNINELTHKIIGCAMTVHSALGTGFQEVIYQRAMAIEMKYQMLSFEREKEMYIYYREEKSALAVQIFLLEGRVMVELKAIVKLEGSVKHKQ